MRDPTDRSRTVLALAVATITGTVVFVLGWLGRAILGLDTASNGTVALLLASLSATFVLYRDRSMRR